MRFSHGIAAVLLAPVLILAACSKDAGELPVAKVKDRVITLDTFEKTYAKVEAKFLPETQDIEGLKEFLDTIINKEVLALKADELGYDKDEYVIEGMKAFRRVGLQAGYTKLMVADKINITEQELKRYYKNFGVTYQVKQILVDTEEEANAVYDMLQEGADFESVCRQYSKGPDAEEGGKVVNALFGTFPPRFNDELFSKKVGEITKPILSQYGWFVIKVVSENRPPQRPYEDVKPDLEKLVESHQKILLSQQMAEDIRKRAGFEFFEDNIKLAFEHLPADRPLTNPPNRSDEVYPLLRISPQDFDKPLVTYKNKFITMSDFSDYYDRASFFQRPRRERRLGDIKKFLVDLVMNELVAEEMETSGIENEPMVAELLLRKREQLMVDKLYQDLIDKQTQIPREEIQNYYTDNMEQFRRSEERRFGAVLTGDRASADEAYRLIRDGGNFERISGKFSVPELKEELRTDERFIQAGERPELDKGFELKSVGDFTQPFETSQGWMILKLYERRPERILALDEARSDITRYLKAVANEERLNELLAKWREEFPIEVYEKNLKKANLNVRQDRPMRFN